MTKDIFLRELIKWLFINDGGYKNKLEWRKALIKKIEDLLEELK